MSRLTPRRRTRPAVALRGLAVAGLAVGLTALPSAGSEPDEIGDPLPDVPTSRTQVGLETVTRDVTAPLSGVTAPGRPSMLYLVDQVGFLKELDVTAPWPVADLPTVLDVTALLGGVPASPKDERGFLGAAFSPTFATDGFLYTYTSEAFVPGTTADFPLPDDSATTECDIAGRQPDHRSVVRRWVRTSSSPLGFAPDGVLFTVDQPQSNHNAGDMHFGPDGMLYIAFGDGGGADDQNCQENFDDTPMFGHGPDGNGQNLTNPLGDILRIDPSGTNSANGRYGVPADNPHVGATDGTLPEIFASGFRNPFRFSFDAADYPASGTAAGPSVAWTGDVGQNHVEEVDLVRAGGNYGWRVEEGTFLFTPDEFQLKGSKSDGFVFADVTGDPTFVDPVAQYDHDDGTAVIGGYVYRGSTVPELAGKYVFGDTSRRLNNAHGRLFIIPGDQSDALRQPEEIRDGPLDVQLIGFGQDSAKELYALVFEPGESGAVLRITGEPED